MEVDFRSLLIQFNRDISAYLCGDHPNHPQSKALPMIKVGFVPSLEGMSLDFWETGSVVADTEFNPLVFSRGDLKIIVATRNNYSPLEPRVDQEHYRSLL